MNGVPEKSQEITPEERCDQIAELFLRAICRMNAGEPPPALIPAKKADRVKANQKKVRRRESVLNKEHT